MALEIQIGALAKSFRTQQVAQHAHHFGTLVVNRDRIEVTDLDVVIGAHRVRHWSAVFGKLKGAQHIHIIDALDRTRIEIGRKLLIAKHGETFFQAQLKPVTAGDAVSGPVVKVFMPDNTLNTVEVIIGRRLW